jgi:hypothetical protein
MSPVMFPTSRAAHRTRLGLQLRLSAAALPGALIRLNREVPRTYTRTALVVPVEVLRGVPVFGLALGLTRVTEIVGAGVAVLTGQALVALMRLPGRWGVLFEGGLYSGRPSTKGGIS